MTPTARTLVFLRRLGFLPTVVESWVPHAELRRDLWGFADVLAIHPRDRLFLLVQTTSAANVSSRLTKARSKPELAMWLKAGGLFEVHGWSQRDGKWHVRRVGVKPDDLEPMPLNPSRPRRHRKGERQRDLFT